MLASWNRCWPVCLEGRDVQAVAEPGSGKTLGYLLPAIPLLLRETKGVAAAQPMKAPMLILVPTRLDAFPVASSYIHLMTVWHDDHRPGSAILIPRASPTLHVLLRKIENLPC